MLKGKAKADWQRSYMRSYRAKRKGLTGSYASDKGLTVLDQPKTIAQSAQASTQASRKVSLPRVIEVHNKQEEIEAGEKLNDNKIKVRAFGEFAGSMFKKTKDNQKAQPFGDYFKQRRQA
jgi:hypothetical protein